MRRSIILCGAASFVSALVGVVAGITLTLPAVVGAQDVAGCTNATLNGAYGARAQGFHVTGPDGTPFAQPVPVVAFNLLLADGAGNITRTGTANVNGTINPNPGTGTYTVSPDCTFTVSFARPSGVPQTIDGVLVNAGTKAFVVTTNPATDPGASVTSVEWERL